MDLNRELPPLPAYATRSADRPRVRFNLDDYPNRSSSIYSRDSRVIVLSGHRRSGSERSFGRGQSLMRRASPESSAGRLRASSPSLEGSSSTRPRSPVIHSPQIYRSAVSKQRTPTRSILKSRHRAMDYPATTSGIMGNFKQLVPAEDSGGSSASKRDKAPEYAARYRELIGPNPLEFDEPSTPTRSNDVEESRELVENVDSDEQTSTLGDFYLLPKKQYQPRAESFGQNPALARNLRSNNENMSFARDSTSILADLPKPAVHMRPKEHEPSFFTPRHRASARFATPNSETGYYAEDEHSSSPLHCLQFATVEHFDPSISHLENGQPRHIVRRARSRSPTRAGLRASNDVLTGSPGEGRGQVHSIQGELDEVTEGEDFYLAERGDLNRSASPRQIVRSDRKQLFGSGGFLGTKEMFSFEDLHSKDDQQDSSSDSFPRYQKKNLFGESGWLGTHMSNLPQAKTEASPKKSKAGGVFDKIRTKFEGIIEKADWSPTKRGFGSSSREKKEKVAVTLPIGLAQVQQAKVFCSLDLLIGDTANHFLLREYDIDHVSNASINKIRDLWSKKGRPPVFEFQFDQLTQRNLIADNQNQMNFSSARGTDRAYVASVLDTWRDNARWMSTRCLCSPDSVIRKLLQDTWILVILLGADMQRLHFLQSTRVYFDNNSERISTEDRAGRGFLVTQDRNTVAGSPGRRIEGTPTKSARRSNIFQDPEA